jgi:hypothetical protein
MPAETTLVTHTLNAIVTATLFLFQMAALEASMSVRLGKDGPRSKVERDAYIRITTKSEAEIMLK